MGDPRAHSANKPFGERVREMRAERGFSLAGVGRLMPKPHGASWMSKVELGQQDLYLSDLYALAEILQVEAGWLLYGDREESEFVARLRGMEPLLDYSGQRTVLATAEFQVEESRKRLAETLSAEEAELIRRFRASSEAERRVTLAQSGPPAPPAQEERTEHLEVQPGTGRSA